MSITKLSVALRRVDNLFLAIRHWDPESSAKINSYKVPYVPAVSEVVCERSWAHVAVDLDLVVQNWRVIRLQCYSNNRVRLRDEPHYPVLVVLARGGEVRNAEAEQSERVSAGSRGDRAGNAARSARTRGRGAVRTVCGIWPGCALRRARSRGSYCMLLV